MLSGDTRYDVKRANCDHSTVMTILSIQSRVIDIVVDRVSDLFEVARRNIEPTSELWSGGHDGISGGDGRIVDSLAMLVDFERLFARAHYRLSGAMAE